MYMHIYVHEFSITNDIWNLLVHCTLIITDLQINVMNDKMSCI